jgi:ABC-type dipeptide/oligopeptide/nickel transport system permease component
MIRYVAGRLAQSVVALFLVTIVVFAMSRATGDPTYLLVGPLATQQQIDDIRHSLGLDQPLLQQYLIYISHLVQGDWGTSIRSGIPVSTLILAALPYSMALSLVAMALAVATGVPLGVLSATHHGRMADWLSRTLAILGQSAPSFLVGIVLVELFAVQLPILPAAGAEGALSYVLPSITLSLYLSAGIARLLRTSMLEVLDSEFVKFARIKGVPERQVIWRHALRNALLPVVAFGGLWLALLMTLNTVVEVVFAWPGVGTLLYNSIVFRDFPLTQGLTLVVVSVLLLINLMVDIVSAWLDPRIKLSYSATT